MFLSIQSLGHNLISPLYNLIFKNNFIRVFHGVYLTYSFYALYFLNTNIVILDNICVLTIWWIEVKSSKYLSNKFIVYIICTISKFVFLNDINDISLFFLMRF